MNTSQRLVRRMGMKHRHTKLTAVWNGRLSRGTLDSVKGVSEISTLEPFRQCCAGLANSPRFGRGFRGLCRGTPVFPLRVHHEPSRTSGGHVRESLLLSVPPSFIAYEPFAHFPRHRTLLYFILGPPDPYLRSARISSCGPTVGPQHRPPDCQRTRLPSKQRWILPSLWP